MTNLNDVDYIDRTRLTRDIECDEDDNECDDTNENEFESGYDDEYGEDSHDDETSPAGIPSPNLTHTIYPINNKSKPIVPNSFPHSHHSHSLYHLHFHHLHLILYHSHHLYFVHSHSRHDTQVHLRHDYLL